MNKKVQKYIKTQCKKKQKYTVYERLEQIAEIHTLMVLITLFAQKTVTATNCKTARLMSYKDGGHSASDDTSYAGVDVLPRHPS